MTHRFLDQIIEDKTFEEIKTELTSTHLKFLNALAQLCGGMEGLKKFIWDFQMAVGELQPKEIIRALQRENKIKEHYEGTGFKARGGRPNKVLKLFEEVQQYAEEQPRWLGYCVTKIAKHYGAHTAPGTRLSHTSRWRLNKKLKEAELPLIPWNSIKPIMDEVEFENAILRYNREARMKEEAEQ